MKASGRSDALSWSLSEFAYILLFISMGAGVLLFSRYRTAADQAIEYQVQVAQLTEEVSFLNELLDEFRYGLVPCWRRPDAEVPAVIGRVTIHPDGTHSVSRTGAPTIWQVAAGGDASLSNALARLARTVFQAELAYAERQSCYLRIEVRNETEAYAPFRDAVATMRGVGIVVVQ